jgi:hypothetical protein
MCTHVVTCGVLLSAVVQDIAQAIIQLVRQVPGWHAPVQACWCVLFMAPAAFTQSPFWAPQASIVISLLAFCHCLLQTTSNLAYGNVCVFCVCICGCNHVRTLVPEPFVWQPGFWGCSCGFDCCDAAELTVCCCCGLRLPFALSARVFLPQQL